MSIQPHLFDDDRMASFVIRGYDVLQPPLPKGFNASVYQQIEALDGNPGDGIYDAVPMLSEVFEHPVIVGALTSLLGADYQMHSHRHCHMNTPGTRSQSWHQDSTNQRHHRMPVVLGFYYPQDVTADNGATVLMPGTHFRNCPTDQMATYANLREQVVLDVPAGTVALAHYDIWHAATANTSDRTRYMLKFLFTRGNEPEAPSWDHDPAKARAAEGRLSAEHACTCSQSDHYKERGLRMEMWRHLLGSGVPEPVGA